jgi:hypothetical protein
VNAREQFLAAVESCVGTPVVHRGRTIGQALDCVGVVVASMATCEIVLADRLDYGRIPSGDQLAAGLEHAGFVRVAVEDRRPGDVLQVYAGQEARHAVVLVADGDLIVHAYGKGNRVAKAPLGSRIGACWRHRRLSDG